MGALGPGRIGHKNYGRRSDCCGDEVSHTFSLLVLTKDSGPLLISTT
jgi:hypothetical protein